MTQKVPNIIQPQLAEPIEYLIIGHITRDLIDSSYQPGGTVTFAGLTAQALGFKTGIITSCSPDLDTSPIDSLWKRIKLSQDSTTFKNVSDGTARTQYLYQAAENITKADIPEFNPQPRIIHLGPMADEVDPEILDCFPKSMKYLTPQGWFRKKAENNRVELKLWDNFELYLSQAQAAVISIEDVQKDENTIAKMAASIPVLAVTENYKGARVYWNDDVRFITAPEVKYLDDTGAGDIFAAAFFYRYFYTKDPWEAGRFAVLLASWSVERKHLNSIPSNTEIKRAKMEVIGY